MNLRDKVDMLYVFDVDNTLVQSSCSMTEDMAKLFKAFVKGRAYFFASGSDLTKMKTQIPAAILEGAAGLFPVMGGQYWKNGVLQYQRPFQMPKGLKDMLETLLEQSPYPVRTGEHIQDRETMICFSTVGKKASPEERNAYIAFEKETPEREAMAEKIRVAFPSLSVTIGGQISIDIAEKGNDKGQILAVLRQEYQAPIAFFGDKIYPGGNDFPFAEALRAESPANPIIAVQNWQETMAFLKRQLEQEAA